MSQIIEISPSILAADFADLKTDIRAVETAGADSLHIDVMDGHFVPNLTFGPALVKSIRPFSTLSFSVHLMVTNPEMFMNPFAQAGADMLLFHLEIGHTQKHMDQIRSLKKEIGIAINPDTPADPLIPYLPHIHQVLIMTVFPGFGGQSFLSEPLKKIRTLRSYIDQHGLKTKIAVDGGINEKTAPMAIAAGAHVLVAGTSIFSNPPALYEKSMNMLRGY